jgi:hypothetical protein
MLRTPPPIAGLWLGLTWAEVRARVGEPPRQRTASRFDAFLFYEGLAVRLTENVVTELLVELDGPYAPLPADRAGILARWGEPDARQPGAEPAALRWDGPDFEAVVIFPQDAPDRARTLIFRRPLPALEG